MTTESERQLSPDDAREIARRWRRAWSDQSRVSEAPGRERGFVLWRARSDGFLNPGVFHPRAMIDAVISDSRLADAVRELVDGTDHQQSAVVVLAFEDFGNALAMTVEKLHPPKPQTWFEMSELRRRSLTKAVWVPLRASQKLVAEGIFGHDGYCEEYFGVGSVMFPVEFHDDSSRLEWMDIGISNNFMGGDVTTYDVPNDRLDGEHVLTLRVPFSGFRVNVQRERPSTERAEITTSLWAGSYQNHLSGDIGTALVIDQHLNSKERSVWHLHQDFVVALGLVREGDVWLRPDEGYVEVARLVRDEGGEPVLLEVRSEQLRDYLCARKQNLYISTYRSRREVCEVRGHIGWETTPMKDASGLQKWEGRISEIHEGGSPYGSKTAVFRVGRADVDDDEDVPEFDFPTDEDMQSESWTKESSGRKLYFASGELWRTEVIEPSDLSERVLGQQPRPAIEFIVDASGKRETRGTLEHGSRWLWFKPHVVRSILQHRGANLSWYTRDTGRLGLVPGSGVHFGINPLGLINVYAKDIALLPDWQQRIWAGANVTPDGKVSSELLDSQMRARPATTSAPEGDLRQAYDAANVVLAETTGRLLFKPHQASEDIFLRAHRFRALDRSGLLELAKDLARLTVESIDGKALDVIVSPPKGMKSGSIRHLEAALATLVDATIARDMTAVLAGVNELRQADAHLPSSDLEDALKMSGVVEPGVTIHEARQILHRLVDCLYDIANTLASSRSR